MPLFRSSKNAEVRLRSNMHL